jgi:hypothetical protein
MISLIQTLSYYTKLPLFIRNSMPKDVFTPEYTPDKAVVESKLVNQTGKNLHVLFPPWHGGGRVYEKLIQRIAKQGDAALAYYFHDEILKPSTEQVLASFENIRYTVVNELTEVVKARRYKCINLIAMSLGNPALAITTSIFRDFDSATLVNGASSLAKSMWHGSRTQHLRAGIEHEGYGLNELEHAWSNLAPINHVPGFIGKDVTMIVSETDSIIPTSYQEELVDAMQAADVNHSVQRTRLGHYASIGKYCLIGGL